MTVRNLDRIFRPASIALIGASRRPGSIGAVVAHNLFNSGFDGPIMPVNPKETSIHGVLSYNTIADLPIVPDLAVIATPPQHIPGLIDELGEKGTKGVVVITAGFAEMGEEGERLQQELVDRAAPHLIRIVGPNCLGVMIPPIGLNASFCHVPPKKGDIACIAQSGAVLTSIVDWATAHGLGFSALASVGDVADVDFGDILDYLAQDPDTKAILLYIEAIRDARKFMSAARAAARAKPVICIKAGRSNEAAAAASSHTGALAGADAVYDAAFRRAGMLRVDTMSELFAAAETIGMGVKPRGDRVAILTNGGGIGVIATDAVVKEGGRLAELKPETIEALDKVMPATWSRGNPVDIIGDAPGKRYADALTLLLDDPGADVILTLNCPTAIADSSDAAQAVVEAVTGKHATLLTSWLGVEAPREAREMFTTARIPTFDTPEEAAKGFLHLMQYKKNQELLMETPASVPDTFSPDCDAARAILNRVMAAGREWLTEPEAKQVLKCYGVPVVETVEAATAEAAAEVAARIGKTVAVKILSPDITHKSDVGGVVLNLATPEAVRAATQAMLDKISADFPDARIDGVTVQEMADMPGAHELIIGMTDDPLFGPVLLFGEGGTAVEVIQDQALALPPLNLRLAADLIERTRIAKLLAGYRDRPAANLDEIALTLVKISQLVADLDEVAELDINPLFANENGVQALDARIKVARPERPGDARLAIRPYPKALEKVLEGADGERFVLRPIRPEDAPLLHDMIAQQNIDDIRLRFFAPLKRLSPSLTARLTQIDYNREMAFVCLKEDGAKTNGAGDQLAGIVRISADPDNTRAEYAIMVRSDLKGHGLGHQLMDEIIAYAKDRGLKEVFGEVLRENSGMLRLCQELGFSRHEHKDDPSIVQVSLALQ